MDNLRARIKRVIKFSHDDREEKQLIIASAIKQLRPIEFYYHGGYRTVEPFALGIVLTDQRDNLSLLCWQTRGFSDNDEIEGWKLYRVSDMEDLEVLSARFTGDRPGYKVENLEMVRLIAFVKPPERPAGEVKTPAPPVEVKAPGLPPPEACITPSSPPRPRFRPIARVLSHNDLMERFRYAHPEKIPEMEAVVWEEPLEAPFPEKPGETAPAEEKPAAEKPQPKIWPDTPVRGIEV